MSGSRGGLGGWKVVVDSVLVIDYSFLAVVDELGLFDVG